MPKVRCKKPQGAFLRINLWGHQIQSLSFQCALRLRMQRKYYCVLKTKHLRSRLIFTCKELVKSTDNDKYASSDFTYSKNILDFHKTFDTGVVDKSNDTYKN